MTLGTLERGYRRGDYVKKNILVFPCGSEIGLEIHRSLSFSTHFTVFGGSSVPDHGAYVYENYISGIPYIDDDNFGDKLNEIVREHGIDYVFPAHDSAVLKLAQLRASGNLLCPVITSPLETCEVARSKSATYKELSKIVATPKLFSDSEIANAYYPLFLKPDVGQGSKGTHIARTPADVAFYRAKDPSLLILEYLPGKEYTIDCFTTREGKLIFCQGRERIRISNGISVSSETVTDDRFENIARAINSVLVFRGVWFFQVKENSAGNLVMLEIAPRVAGTMGLERGLGINLPLLSLFDAEGYNVDILQNTYKLTIDRALENKYKHSIQYEHVYMDYDDLVIFDGKVNLSVVAFIYQCINEGVKVHLLTRHNGDLKRSLERYRLTGLFDEIIWIRDDTQKYQYISHRNAIFIDDSHAERIGVYQQLRIPVFDAHSLEALMK